MASGGLDGSRDSSTALLSILARDSGHQRIQQLGGVGDRAQSHQRARLAQPSAKPHASIESREERLSAAAIRRSDAPEIGAFRQQGPFRLGFEMQVVGATAP